MYKINFYLTLVYITMGKSKDDEKELVDEKAFNGYTHTDKKLRKHVPKPNVFDERID